MRRPWNIIDSSVYSLATYATDGQVNMNICTYVMAISRQPKLYAVGIEHGSQTLDLWKANDMAVLQILSTEQTHLIRPLGKRSGRDYDKMAYLQKKNALTDWHKHSVLKDAAAYVLLQTQSITTTGDHDLFICKALKYKTLSEEVLRFSDLIHQKIIL